MTADAADQLNACFGREQWLDELKVCVMSRFGDISAQFLV